MRLTRSCCNGRPLGHAYTTPPPLPLAEAPTAPASIRPPPVGVSVDLHRFDVDWGDGYYQ